MYFFVLLDSFENFLNNGSNAVVSRGEDGGVWNSLYWSGMDLLRGGYQMMLMIGVIGFLLSSIILSFKISVPSTGAEKQEAKSHIITLLICAMVVFGIIGIIGTVETIGRALGA